MGAGISRSPWESTGTSPGGHSESRKGIPAFPFCHVTLRGRKPREGYPEEPTTLGEHLKRRRLDLGLRQKDVAERLGVTKNSYENWEHDKHEPEFRYWPGIVAFLGYDPRQEPESLAGRIRATRQKQGLSQRELARRLGIDPSTITAWEAGTVEKPYPRFVRLFEEFVEGV